MMAAWSFFDYLERLRRRPEAERQRLVFFIAALLTLIIFTAWLVNFRFLLTLEAEVRPAQTLELGINDRLAAGAKETWRRIRAGWQFLIYR